MNGWAIFSEACASWPKRLRDVCACRKANALARRTLVNFIVAAGMSRLKLLLCRNNERTDIRCHGIYATEPENRPPSP